MSGLERHTVPVHVSGDAGSAARTERLHHFSHALRNKLGGLMEAIRFLDQDLPHDQRNEIASFAERKFFEGLREVESLLDDMGVERGMGQLHREDTDLGQLLQQAVAEVLPRLERKGQQLDLSINSPLPVSGDPHYLTPLLQALLSNASKFSAAGATIQVRASMNADHVLLQVIDPGVGLSEDDLKQVFTRYAWLESRTTAGESQGRSSLARAQQWAQAHGGTLRAFSAGVGQGCTFTLTLPAIGR
ncbi:MAG: HAMP domain-containing histidine kinase [Flavobacteriales bacterium]|nr:HAMP domain-containing histidine kinase [Flavobacteriales bacterium]